MHEVQNSANVHVKVTYNIAKSNIF